MPPTLHCITVAGVPVLSLEPLLHGEPSTGWGRDLWVLLQAQGYFAPSNVV